MSFCVRKASKNDLPALRHLAEASFIATYAAQNPPHVLNQYVEKAFTDKQFQQEFDDDANIVFVAVEDDTLTGYLNLRMGKIPDCILDPKSIEIKRLYTDPDRKGQGIGSALMRAAENVAKSMGYTCIWLGVFQKNKLAIAFYEKKGLTIAGEKIFMMGDDPQKDYVMVKSI